MRAFQLEYHNQLELGVRSTTLLERRGTRGVQALQKRSEVRDLERPFSALAHQTKQQVCYPHAARSQHGTFTAPEAPLSRVAAQLLLFRT